MGRHAFVWLACTFTAYCLSGYIVCIVINYNEGFFFLVLLAKVLAIRALAGEWALVTHAQM